MERAAWRASKELVSVGPSEYDACAAEDPLGRGVPAAVRAKFYKQHLQTAGRGRRDADDAPTNAKGLEYDIVFLIG